MILILILKPMVLRIHHCILDNLILTAMVTYGHLTWGSAVIRLGAMVKGWIEPDYLDLSWDGDMS